MAGSKRDNLGTVVIGTVREDVHHIGKVMIAMLLTVQGFKALDLGVSITAEQFL